VIWVRGLTTCTQKEEFKIKHRLRYIRAVYWIGAITDFIMVFAMTIPQFASIMFGIEGFDPGIEYKLGMGMGAALMLGWTVLLIWADRKPIERKGVLLITAVPVVVGITATAIAGVSVGFFDPISSIPVWFLQAFLLAILISSYILASRISKQKEQIEV
jgi:hypothetical protein